MSDLNQTILPHLREQFSRARAILFTGAGFSLSTRNLEGMPLPSPQILAERIWELVFPGEPYDATSSLQDIYEAALESHSQQLAELLTTSLSVVPESIEDWLGQYFRLPWHRIYTLNVDTAVTAVNQQFDLPRPIVETSATASVSSNPEYSESVLEVIHLNGTIGDIPSNVTFSGSQYARRLASPDHLYQQLVADLVSRPIIFIGTSLDEAPLWQSIELRHMRGSRSFRELRPRSYLVTPELNRARQARLEAFNIFWIKMTAREFAEQVLEQLHEASQKGISYLRIKTADKQSDTRLQEVADLSTNPRQSSEFLLGAEPIWADIQSSRAISRECDAEFEKILHSQLAESETRGVIAITGTAGSGKSTSLMGLALKTSYKGYRVGWVDRNTDLAVRSLISAMKLEDSPEILTIDEAEVFGSSLSYMLREIALQEKNPLILVSIRAGTIDRVLNPTVLQNIPIHEVTVPHLENSDIDSLLHVLDRENRLGALKGNLKLSKGRLFEIMRIASSWWL